MPERGEIATSSLIMDIPLNNDLPGWFGERKQESEQERAILAKDTQFSKADYFNLGLGKQAGLYPVNFSIVLSGTDMNSSIHRPELCLPSQGHFSLLPSSRSLTLDNGKKLTFTVLHSLINLSSNSKSPHIIKCINYYVFVGHKTLTHSHEKRVLIDTKRRILHGQDQQWAYIQAGVYYGSLALKDGSTVTTTEEKATQTLEKLLVQLLPLVIKWDDMEM